MNKMNRLIYQLICLTTVLASCSDVLDKNDLSAISEQDVWNDEVYATAVVDRLHRENSPGWNGQSSAYFDDAVGTGMTLAYGTMTSNSENYWPYDQIRRFCQFIENIDNGSLSAEVRGKLKAQALVMRAEVYFRMVRSYGGVPMIMKAQVLSDDLLVTRDKTSECIRLIVKDLDDAIAIEAFPMSWSGKDAGRLSKASALALKGRILLYWASPQFNPNNDQSRWDAAYTANREARDAISAAGYGLYESFENIWFDEMNKEAVYVTRYAYPNMTHSWDAGTRPPEGGLGFEGLNKPTWELAQAFPMITGEPITESSVYDPVLYWKNRDPRFAATIAWNGCLWELYGQAGRRLWTYAESVSPSGTHLYCRKAINENYTLFEASINGCGTDWIEIRYAEVLLNLAEAAARTGHVDEAYDLLKQIRQRAGILPGSDGLYGLKAGMNATDMTDAVMLERRVELAMEGKRYWDMRRWRKLSELNGTRRHGRLPKLKDGVSPEDLEQADMENNYGDYFEDEVDEADKTNVINFPENYYFYPIHNDHLNRNSNLKQTQGWDDGTFNPLE
jgi:hypothetical protein